MSISTTAQPEVKFATPNNDLFYAASLYQPLQPERQEIRLLRLLPGQFPDQLRCEIVVNVYLSENPPKYHALSYCAGDASVVETIKVQNIDFNVFKNLGLGLHRIRKTDEPILIWIDQICINHIDNSEREQQVLMMRTIYASASKTILWLGEEANNHPTGLAISFLRGLCDKARSVQVSEYGDFQNALSKLFEIMREQNPGMDVLPDTPTNPSSRTLVFNEKLVAAQGQILADEVGNGKHIQELASVVALYKMPWWKRSWVMQEAIVSKNAELLYGGSNLDMDALRLANGILTMAYRAQFNAVGQRSMEENFRNLIHLIEIGGVNKLLQLEDKWRTRPNLPMREVLNVSRQVESTNPCDRVYSMLGLMDQKYNIIPDYSSSNTAASTFTTAVKASIEHDGHLDILSDGHEQDRHSELDLPSWVPDFTVAPFNFSMCNWEHTDGKSLFNASLQAGPGEKSPLPELPKPEFLPDKNGRPDRVLRCLMLDLGVLAEETTIGAVPDLGAGGVDASLEAYSRILIAAGLSDTYPSTFPEMLDRSPDQPLQAALLQTLSCGVTPGGHTTADLTPGDLEFGKTLFLDRYTQVTALGTWRFFVTPTKTMGVAPAAAQWDDTLCILMGAKVPFVLRRIVVEDSEADGQDYTLIGPAYLHGYMSGQAVVDIFKGKRKAEFTFIHLH